MPIAAEYRTFRTSSDRAISALNLKYLFLLKKREQKKHEKKDSEITAQMGSRSESARAKKKQKTNPAIFQGKEPKVGGGGRVLLPGANKNTPRPPPRESEKLGGGSEPKKLDASSSSRWNRPKLTKKFFWPFFCTISDFFPKIVKYYHLY